MEELQGHIADEHILCGGHLEKIQLNSRLKEILSKRRVLGMMRNILYVSYTLISLQQLNRRYG